MWDLARKGKSLYSRVVSVVSLVQQPLKAMAATKRTFALSSPCALRPCWPFHMGSETPWQLWLGRDRGRGTAAVPPCVHWGGNEDPAHLKHSPGLWHHRNELVGCAECCALTALGVAHWKSLPTPSHHPWEMSPGNQGALAGAQA